MSREAKMMLVGLVVLDIDSSKAWGTVVLSH